tara:strand:- start:190 stop:1689 length:1500 start_codon:yes stop_codon:yes gene_type:complete
MFGKKDEDIKVLDKCEWFKIPLVVFEKKIDIVEKAKQDAANNDFIGSTVTEGEIRQLAEDYKNKNQEAGQDFFFDLENQCQIIDANIEKSRDTFSNILKRARSDFGTIKSNFKSILKNLLDQKIQNKQILDTFKLNHHRNQFAKIASTQSFIFMFVMFIVLASVEIITNRILIGGVVTGGVNEGLIVSVIIAVVNVILTALIGYFVVKHIHNTELMRRNLAKIVLAVWVPVVIIYMNWCVGALRVLGQQATQKALSVRRSSVSTEQADKLQPEPVNINEVLRESLQPWDVDKWDLTGVLLVLIGISFAVASLVKAYLIDDTYPNYGKLSRAYVKAKNAIKDKCDEMRNESAELRLDCLAQKNELKAALDENIKDFWEYTNNIQKEGDSYEKIMKANHEKVFHILKEYRSVAREHLNAKNREIPDRFAEEINFYSDDDLNCEKIFAVSMHYHYDDLPRKEKTGLLTKKLMDSNTYVEEEINELAQKMNNDTTEIQKEYDI